MLSWIPLLGPIIQGLLSTGASIYKTFASTEVGLAKEQVAEEQVAAQIIHDTNDDIGVRILRDAALVFPVLWSAVIGWDTIIAGRWNGWAWIVPDYPPNVQYIPYAAFAFLFGVIGMNIWKRKM